MATVIGAGLRGRIAMTAATLLVAMTASGAGVAAPIAAQHGTDATIQAGMAPHDAAVQSQIARIDAAIGKGRFKADWNSLGQYRVPEWYRDAKFGIFIHWGVYSVPASGSEWYSRNMYVAGSPDFAHHIATYGNPSRFGYKDFIPAFTGSHFDPVDWVALFRHAGARYVVPVAEHCDGFAMYDSAITRWNAVRMGPHRDVVGELARATRGAGLHFGLSSHRAEHWWWNGQAPRDSDVFDPAYADLYGPAAARHLPGMDTGKEPDPDHLEQWLAPDRPFLDDWLARTGEAIEKYRPDFVYLDWWVNQPAFTPYLKRLAAYYYNTSSVVAPVLAYKGEAFAPGTALYDIERGRLDALRQTPWQTDTSVSIASWGYVANDRYRTADSLIATLVDAVSKNGNLLLNVGPRADGTIPDEARTVLTGIGDWLSINGEAIYGTRPWVLFGEGPTRNATHSLSEGGDPAYAPADIRFTTHGSTLYAIGLARPVDDQVLIRSLYAGNPYASTVASVHLLGSAKPLVWHSRADGLAVSLSPAAATKALAGREYALKIDFNPPASR